jgi:hypothetical protein
VSKRSTTSIKTIKLKTGEAALIIGDDKPNVIPAGRNRGVDRLRFEFLLAVAARMQEDQAWAKELTDWAGDYFTSERESQPEEYTTNLPTLH